MKEVRKMGYVLPIKPIQSEQYANRLNIEPYNFAHVGRVNKINLKSDFLEDFEAHLLVDEKRGEEREDDDSEKQSSPQSLKGYGYIQPNPANLSPAISQIVGKGININAYV